MMILVKKKVFAANTPNTYRWPPNELSFSALIKVGVC